MKENLITNEHFNYATKIMKIMGFNSISDFDTLIYYDKLKIQEVNICSKISTTMDEFKKLFPLNEFDLRRIKYKFENINQVIGFVKKLSLYLAIPLNTTRTNNSTVMRLIQSKYFLYNNYINSMNMRDTATIETILIKSIDEIKNNDINNKIEIENQKITKENNCKEIENQKITKENNCKEIEKEIKNEEIEINKKPVKSSQVLKFKKLLPFEQEFIVNSSFLLTYFSDFKWINWIKIAILSDEMVNKLTNETEIVLSLGGSILEKYTINQSTLFEDEYFKIPVDFFNNHFYIYHNFKIDILSNNKMFKIIINGNDFTKKLPKSYLENKMIIECDHDSKYFVNDVNNPDICLFTWKIMYGMTGASYIKKQSNEDLITWEIIKKKINEYKENGKVKNVDNNIGLLPTLFLIKDYNDEIQSKLYYDYFLKNNLLTNYQEFVIRDYVSIKYLYIEEEYDENSVIYYSNPYPYIDSNNYNNIQVRFESLIGINNNLIKIQQINNDNEKRHLPLPFIEAIVKTKNINDFLEIKVKTVVRYPK